ncbi:MAG TPA: hypothetical protein VL337_16000 [Acidimicrobiales bacterium]|nr:hypothetical protein [Acidimicrobiales bacterium]
MAAVAVFVDDAIRGDLPAVCARTGEPADLQVRIRQSVGGGIPWYVWLLFFLGPLGVGAFVLAALSAPGTEYLTVRVPRTRASFDRERQLGLWRLTALGTGAAVPFLGAFGLHTSPELWLAVAVGCFLAAGALTWALWRRSIGVGIDASRRWVTLSNVHPAFAAAVQRRESLTVH